MTPRVLILTTYYHPVLGGVETHARRLASHLHRNGFEVQVVTKRVSGQQAAEALVDDVRVYRVGPIGDRRGRGKWVVLPRFFAKTLQLGTSFDVIVCIDFRGIGIAAVAAGRLLHRAVILQAETGGALVSAGHGSSSGVPPEHAVVRALKNVPRAIYRRADHIVCIGHDIEREALDTGVPRERVHYLPHGVDLLRFRPAAPGERELLRTSLGWPTDRPIVLFVGRLSIEKGVLDLLEAWRLVDRRDALLVLVGPDMPAHPWDAGRKARAYVAQHGLEDRVRFEGPAAETSHLFRAADLFTQPSHFEAFGLSAIEAMASGVPIIASKVGGLIDFLVDNDNALLHEPRSPASIAAALTHGLWDASLRARLAKKALETVTAEFDERVLLDRYARLIERAPGTRR
jgi:glycosyltransferase involved in cell wall biosynthesis